MTRILAISIFTFAMALQALGEEISITIDATGPTPDMVSPYALRTAVDSFSVVVKTSRGRPIRRDDHAYGMIYCDSQSSLRATCNETLYLPPGLYKILVTHNGEAVIEHSNRRNTFLRSVDVKFKGSIVFSSRRREARISNTVPTFRPNEVVVPRTCVDQPHECSTLKTFSVR